MCLMLEHADKESIAWETNISHGINLSISSSISGVCLLSQKGCLTKLNYVKLGQVWLFSFPCIMYAISGPNCFKLG